MRIGEAKTRDPDPRRVEETDAGRLYRPPPADGGEAQVRRLRGRQQEHLSSVFVSDLVMWLVRHGRRPGPERDG